MYFFTIFFLISRLSLRVWFDKSINSWKMGSRPGSPFGLEGKAPWTSWMFNYGGFTDSPHPHKQETGGLDTIQATSLFSWWLILLFQEHFEEKGDLYKILKSGNMLRNHTPVSQVSCIANVRFPSKTWPSVLCIFRSPWSWLNNWNINYSFIKKSLNEMCSDEMIHWRVTHSCWELHVPVSLLTV